jgi:hypothetical protein
LRTTTFGHVQRGGTVLGTRFRAAAVQHIAIGKTGVLLAVETFFHQARGSTVTLKTAVSPYIAPN